MDEMNEMRPSVGSFGDLGCISKWDGTAWKVLVPIVGGAYQMAETEDKMKDKFDVDKCPHCGGSFVLVKIEEKWGQKPEATYQCDQCGKHVITKTLKALPVKSREAALLARAENAEAIVERLIEAGESMSIAVQVEDANDANAYRGWKNLVGEWEHRNDKPEEAK